MSRVNSVDRVMNALDGHHAAMRLRPAKERLCAEVALTDNRLATLADLTVSTAGRVRADLRRRGVLVRRTVRCADGIVNVYVPKNGYRRNSESGAAAPETVREAESHAAAVETLKAGGLSAVDAVRMAAELEARKTADLLLNAIAAEPAIRPGSRMTAVQQAADMPSGWTQRSGRRGHPWRR